MRAGLLDSITGIETPTPVPLCSGEVFIRPRDHVQPCALHASGILAVALDGGVSLVRFPRERLTDNNE